MYTTHNGDDMEMVVGIGFPTLFGISWRWQGMDSAGLWIGSIDVSFSNRKPRTWDNLQETLENISSSWSEPMVSFRCFNHKSLKSSDQEVPRPYRAPSQGLPSRFGRFDAISKNRGCILADTSLSDKNTANSLVVHLTLVFGEFTSRYFSWGVLWKLH